MLSSPSAIAHDSRHETIGSRTAAASQACHSCPKTGIRLRHTDYGLGCSPQYPRGCADCGDHAYGVIHNGPHRPSHHEGTAIRRHLPGHRDISPLRLDAFQQASMRRLLFFLCC